MSRRRRSTAVAFTCAVLAACGVPEDEAPQELSQPLPPALIETETTSSTQAPTSETMTIYLVRRTDGQLTLEPVEREVDVADPAAAINAVLSPATAEESEAGLSTLFGEGTGLVETVSEGEVLDVRLDSLAGFPADPNSTDYQVAVAMLVCTATTSFADVSSVLVSIAQDDGSFRPIAIRLPEETAQPAEAQPVTCEQFAPFLTGEQLPPTTVAGPGTTTGN